MTKTFKAKEVDKIEESETKEVPVVTSGLSAIIEAYKLQNPAKYEAKKAELEAKLNK